MKKFLLVIVFQLFFSPLIASDIIDTETVQKLIKSNDTNVYPVIALFYEKEKKYDTALLYWQKSRADSITKKHIKLIKSILNHEK